MAADLDVVFVLDARFEGGVSTAVATELQALCQDKSLRIGLLMVKAHLLGIAWPVHPAIRRFITDGSVTVLRPGEDWTCQLALIHHPVTFENLPRTALPLRAERGLLILHHPMFNAAGARQYDLDAVASIILSTLTDTLLIAPVSPVVRRALHHHTPKFGRIADEDWVNLLDVPAWPFDPDRSQPSPDHVVIGRHARPDPLKWPEDRAQAFAAYLADDPEVELRILGGGDFLDALYGPTLPANWVQLPFDPEGVPGFLAGLDFFVFYHSTSWLEAFGRNILEALACGIVTILPPEFEASFGPAAIYAAPEDVRATIDEFVADPAAWHRQRRKARTWVQVHHSASLAQERLNTFGLRRKTTPRARAPRRKQPVLFVSTNGIGVGHLTQQMAIADRLPDHFLPVFASMSLSLGVARKAGYPVFYLPHHKHLQADPGRWNAVFAEELFDLIRHLQPAMLAYDGTAVFGGLADVLGEYPDLITLWVRRAMWRDMHQPFLDHASLFTAIIEPGELAGELDHGPTRAERPLVHVTGPVLHIDPGARLTRAEARQHYGLDDPHLAVALQLGSGANYELQDLRRAVVEHLLSDARVQIIEIVSPLAPMPPLLAGAEGRLIQIREYPSFLYSRAFDAAIGVAGYNSFHEQVLGGIPTLFVPNEAPEMDSQLTRAHWAEVNGFGLCLRARHGVGALKRQVARLLDDGFRAECARRMAGLPAAKGACEIAEFVADYSAMIRTDRWPRDAYPR
ncbi:MAG: glycosyltransferase [Paracoccaceae bacterium]